MKINFISFHNLSLDDAIKIYNNINLNFKPVNITLNNITCDYMKNFHSIYYTVNCNNKPEWCPINPHISFQYLYDKKIKITDIINLLDIEKNGILNELVIVKCDGHHLHWVK